MDIKAMYQEQAEELAEKWFGTDLIGLSEDVQVIVYNEAMVVVNDKLVSQAEARGDAMEGR